MLKPEPGQLRKAIGEKLERAGAHLQRKTLDQDLGKEPVAHESGPAGILTDREIKDLGLVVGGVDANYMAASYDLRVGRLIDPDGKVSTSYLLPAQGIVEAISQETVKLPDRISGFAMVKTRLCQEGILALSIGIIDPRFEGRISSFLINFGKREKLIQQGDVFLRSTFHHLSGMPDKLKPVTLDYQNVISTRRREIVANFDKTFLSLEHLTSESSKKVFNEYKTKALAYVSAIAFFLALLTFLINFSTIWLKWPEGPVATVTQNPAGSVEVRELLKKNEELSRRLSLLEAGRSATPRSGSTEGTR